LIGLALWMFLAASTVYAGTYLSSSHGNTAYGVNRSSTSQYSKGNCAHCHEQHASIDGSEPDPFSGSPSQFALFYTNHTSQTDNFCFKCHCETNSVAASAITNRSYSYRAGGWTADPLNDILEAFTTGGGNTPPSAHNLDDISTFIDGKWGYTANSNPCAACHSVHALQGDPANSAISGNSAKSLATRGYPVSRPSQHSTNATTWGLWGDGAGEKMSDYAGPTGYQAPYRYNSFVVYEPDGSATTNGSNMTDFNTFCIDCHDATNTIYSTTKLRNLRKFDWNLEKHGKGDAADDADYTDLKPPYSEGTRYVLACTDCHEPHGSPNVFLIRKWVNNITPVGILTNVPVTVTVTAESGEDTTRAWKSLCLRCHTTDSTVLLHHLMSIEYYPLTGKYHCEDCHPPPSYYVQVCIACHYHGSTTAVIPGASAPYEPLF
jgi:hypothetical protein